MKSFYQSIVVLSLIIVLVLTSCEPGAKESQLYGEIITKTNISDIFKKLRTDKDFTTQDFEYFTNGMTRLVTLSEDSLMGKTVAQVINEQKLSERDQVAAYAANQAIKVELVLNHEFKYLGMKPTTIDGKDSVKEVDFLVYELMNKSDKEIIEVRGMLQFLNQDNQLVKAYPIIASKVLKGEVIKPGETKRFTHPFDHDVNNKRDEIVRNDHANLKPVWICTYIEFKDGSKITVTNTL